MFGRTHVGASRLSVWSKSARIRSVKPRPNLVNIGPTLPISAETLVEMSSQIWSNSTTGGRDLGLESVSDEVETFCIGVELGLQVFRHEHWRDLAELGQNLVNTGRCLVEPCPVCICLALAQRFQFCPKQAQRSANIDSVAPRGVISASRSVFLTMVLLCTVVFLFGVTFKQLTRNTALGEKNFKSLGSSMFNLLIYATFPDFAQIVEDASGEHFVFGRLLWLSWGQRGCDIWAQYPNGHPSGDTEVGEGGTMGC